MTDASGTAAAAGPSLPLVRSPWQARVVDPDGDDLQVVYAWMHAPHVAAFWHQAWTAQRWAREITALRDGGRLPCVVLHDSEPVAYLEARWARSERMAKVTEVHEHDLAIRLAIGDISRTGQGLGRRVIEAVTRGLFEAEPGCQRILADPAVANEPAVRSFTAAGFTTIGELVEPGRTEVLMAAERARLT
jgi:RimJ/RimL family protein N-acetyltransferase